MENTKQIVAKNNNSGEGVTETQKQEYIHLREVMEKLDKIWGISCST